MLTAMQRDGGTDSGLRRTLGWPSVAAYGLGAILGAGIYSVIGVAAARVGDGMWIAFALSALVALMTALSYAELATMFPRAGAEFLYVRSALPGQEAIAATVGMLMAVAATATAATVALAFGGYLSALISIPSEVVAALLLVALAMVAMAGIKEATWTVAIFTCIEVAGLVLVIALGATSDRLGAAFAATPTPAVFSGAALVFFSYLGFENIANLAEETRQPERNLPRAILVSLAIATALYVAVAVAAVALMPASELALSDAPLADAVRARSPRLAGALGGIALFATANTAMAAIISGSRILYAMGNAGAAPRPLTRVLRGRRTPWVATLVVMIIALALVPLGSIAVLASLTSFASLVAFATVNASLVILRVRQPALRRPFRVPVRIAAVPLIPLAGAIAAILLVTQLDLRVLAYGAALIVLALGTFTIVRWAQRRA